jgi:transposase
VINAIRAHLAEFGIVAPLGRRGVEELLGVVADPKDKRLPEIARACLAALGAQLRVLKKQILEFDRMINAWHRSSETGKRLDEIPGVGPALATALVASVANPRAFRSGRDFSAWIGLAEATLEWGQGQARQYQQTRRSLSAQPVHGRRTGCDPLRQDPWHQTPALAHCIVGQAANEGRRDRTRQQDRTNGLGHDGQG